MPKRKAMLSIEHALLGFLRQNPLHTYEIYQQLQQTQALGAVWRLKQAHLYALIDRLEAEGLIKATVVPQETRPAKHLLHITDAGRAAFGQWLRTPVEHGRDLRIEFLAKLFWAQQEGQESTQHLIAQQRSMCDRWLHDLQSELNNTDDQEPFTTLVLQFRAGQTKAMLHWLDNCETLLLPMVAHHE